MNKYLIIGVHPTPNGPLHLGHVAGPFLSLDILARCKKIIGHDVFYVSGTDSYESHVSLKSFETGFSELDIAKFYSDRIYRDLNLLDINLDSFIPLHEYEEEYFKLCQEIIELLVINGSAVDIKEVIPYDSKHKKYLVGGWISGVCPSCKKGTSSFYCENCGTHHRPEEMHPHSFKHTQNDNVSYKEVNSLFLEVDFSDIYNSARARYPGGIIDRYVENLISKKGLITTRLTLPQSYGPSIKFPIDDYKIAFSYTVGLTAFYILCGEIYAKKNGNVDVFNDDKVTVVTAYGFDNIPAYLAGMDVISKLKGFEKFVDFNIVNEFLLLNGSKFSTSRNHALWVRKLVEEGIFNCDMLRLAMALYCPSTERKNFDTAEIVNHINKFIYYWNELVARIIATQHNEINFIFFNGILKDFTIICNKDESVNVEISTFIFNLLSNGSMIADEKILSYFVIIMFCSMPVLSQVTSEFFEKILSIDSSHITIDSILNSSLKVEDIICNVSFESLYFDCIDLIELNNSVGVL